MKATNIDDMYRLGGCTIVCGPDAVPATLLALAIYLHHGIDMPISVLTPERCARDARWLDFPYASISVDEDVKDLDRIASFLLKHDRNGALRGRSTNWYLQQYLKLAHVWDASQPIFIHDGDTIFSPRLLNEMLRSPFLMTTKENTTTYNATALACGLPIHKASFVANGGVFCPKALRVLSKNPADWFIETMERGVLAKDAIGDLSEYQLMGSLLQSRLPVRQIKIFRRFDLLVSSPLALDANHKCRRALEKYDALAFETAHRSTLIRKLIGRIAYNTGYSW